MGNGVEQRTHLQSPAKLTSTDFKHFVWRGHRREDSLHELVPEMVTTDGQIVRRVIADERGLTLQEFEDRRTAAAIVEAVEKNCAESGGLLGYSMLAECNVLTIMSAEASSDVGWLASTSDAVEGRPRQMPTLPMDLAQVPTIRVTGTAESIWNSRTVQMTVRLEQRRDSGGGVRGPTPLEHLASCELLSIVERGDQRRHISLSQPIDRSAFTALPDSEFLVADLEVDHELYQRVIGGGPDRVWIRLTFEETFFSLPRSWRRWWFPVAIGTSDSEHPQ